MTSNPWDSLLAHVHQWMDEEAFRRWFGATAYASDSGDQITVWVPSEPIRRHIEANFQSHLRRALEALERPETHIRFVVAGTAEDEDEDEEPRAGRRWPGRPPARPTRRVPGRGRRPLRCRGPHR